CFFFTSRSRYTRSKRDWSSDVCSSDLKKTSMNCVRFCPEHQKKEAADHGTFYDTFSVLQPSSLWNHRYLFLSPDSIQNTACRTDAVPSLACAAYTVCHSVSSGSPF